MIYPTYQTQTGTGEDGTDIGNCLVASIATITGTPIADIPHFVEQYLEVFSTTVQAMTGDDWLTVLAGAQIWLTDQGFSSAAVEQSPAQFGAFGVPRLALVMAGGTVPHIIVADQRGMQMWDPNPTSTEPYAPADVLAMLEITKTPVAGVTPVPEKGLRKWN